MLFLKPLLKTIIISSLLFFVLVYLGMKYHWIGFYPDDNKNMELTIPDSPAMLNTNNSTNVNSEMNQASEEFQPQIIQSVRFSTAVSNLNKEQIRESCTSLLRRTILNVGLLELAVGDCVISNYRDSIREIDVNTESLSSAKNGQVQIQKNNSKNACIRRLNHKNYSNEVEKQLLLGICMSREFK
jgi:hypothetical protein